MKTLTPQQIVDLNPCKGYDLKQVTELFDNKKSLTYLEILDTDKIPSEDIVWLLCQPGILDRDIRDQWTEIIVTRAVTNHVLHCGVNKVEKWAKNWLSGDNRTAEAAYVAHADATYAADAAYAAADYTADAAYAAAEAAADAAYAAAEATADAAYAAAEAAADAYSAARNNEYKQQIQDLKDILQGEM